MVQNLMQGKWIDAFYSHSIFFLGFLYLIIVHILLIVNIVRKKKVATWLYPNYQYGIFFVILLLLYTIARNLL